MLETYISKFWLQVFKDAEFIDNLLKGLEDRYDQMDLDVTTLNNSLSRYTIDIYRKQKWLFVTYDESEMNQDAMLFDQDNVYFNGLYNFGDHLHNFFTLPIDSSIKKIPFIMSSPVNPTTILQENIDYLVNYDRNLIFFRNNPFSSGFDKRFLDSVDDPELGIGMWFFNSDKDYDDINEIYAETVKLSVTSSEYFKKIINAIWDLRVEGGTINNVNKLLCATVDTDFVITGGTLKRIFTEGGRKWVEIDDNLYNAPESVSVLPDIGDTVIDGELVFDSVQTFTGLDDIPYASFPALHLSQNFIGANFTDGVMVENVDYPFPAKELVVLVDDAKGFYLVKDITSEALTYLAEGVDGFIIDLLVTDASYDYIFINARWDLPFFGRDDTVDDFKNYLLGIAAREGRDLTDVIVEDNYGHAPATINLFTEYQQRAFKNNAFFVSIDTDLIPAGVDPGMFLSYLKFTVPAYTTLLTFLSTSSTVTYDMSSISETVEAFYTVDVAESYSGDNITDNVNRKLSI